MSEVLVLDTHALIWFLQGDPRLGTTAGRRLRVPDVRLIVPAISLTEACFMVETGRTAIRSVEDLLGVISNLPHLHVAPLTTAVIRRGAGLTAIREIHDRQIVATTLRLIDRGLPAILVTRDREITESKLVPVVW